MDEAPLKVREVSDRELHISLQSKTRFIKEIRTKLREFASEIGFSEDEIFDIQLAVNEALANIMKHAYKGAEDGKIDVRVNTDSTGAMVICIRDWGQKPDRDAIKSRDLEDFRENGLGVFLMNQLVDEVEFDDSPECGMILKLKKRRT